MSSWLDKLVLGRKESVKGRWWIMINVRMLYGVRAEMLQSYLTLWDPMDCRLPGSSVHGISQARILEWVATSCSREIFLTQRSKPCVLYWQVDSSPLNPHHDGFQTTAVPTPGSLTLCLKYPVSCTNSYCVQSMLDPLTYCNRNSS